LKERMGIGPWGFSRRISVFQRTMMKRPMESERKIGILWEHWDGIGLQKGIGIIFLALFCCSLVKEEISDQKPIDNPKFGHSKISIAKENKAYKIIR
jgi:hypothetical protein